MTTGNAMGSGAKAAIVILGLVGSAVLGNFIWNRDQPVAPEPAANLASSPAPAAEPESAGATPAAGGKTPEAEGGETATAANLAEAETPSPPEPVAEAEPVLTAVSIENWRVEADGAGLISGRTAPLAIVSVLIDGAKVTETVATAAGDFVLLFTLLPNDKPSLMTIEAALPDGTTLPSPAAIALAPIKGPEVVTADAAAVPEPEAAPSAEPEPAPTAVMVTEEGAKVVSATPELAGAGGEGVPVSIAAIAYTPEGNVQLSGSGTSGQTVRLYLNNDLAAETAVLPDNSWQVILTETPPGIYTLRADQIDASGKVTARFETPFKRETPEALAALAEPKLEPEEEVAVAADGQSGAAPVAEVAVAAPAVPDAADVTEDAAAAPTEAVEPSTEVQATIEAEAAPSEPGAVSAEAASSEEPVAVAISEVASQPAQAGADSASSAAPAAETTSPGPTESNAQQPAPTAPQPVDETPSQTTAGVQPSQPGAETSPDKVSQTVSITVQPGYSLWKIARDTYGDGILYVQVYEANKEQIGDPDLIYPGQVFELPRK